MGATCHYITSAESDRQMITLMQKYCVTELPVDLLLCFLLQQLRSALSNTIPWEAATNDTIQHILKHNKYGALQAQLIAKAFPDVFIMTSSFDRNQPYAASIQNVDMSWANLKRAVNTVLYHSMFGGPLIR